MLASLQHSWGEFVVLLPDLVTALVLLTVGWLVAKVARRLTVRALHALRVDTAAERSGLDDFLTQGGVTVTTVTLIGGTVYWLILAGVFMALLDALGLHTAGALLERLVQFVPNLVLAVGILVFGSLLSRVLGGLVYSYLNNIGGAGAEPIGALARYALLTFAVFMAAEQLTIRTEILVSTFQIAFAAVCLAAALAFGLGGREWAAQVISKYAKKQRDS
ncbi:MAG: hypothetical protein ABI880_02130 [Acidobacteriota bacterium]